MTESFSESFYEERQIRCPRLGGPVDFSYCRVENVGKPCSKALSCWRPYFDVDALFHRALTDEEFAQCFLKPAPTKVETLLDLIEKAKKVVDPEDDPDRDSDACR